MSISLAVAGDGDSWGHFFSDAGVDRYILPVASTAQIARTVGRYGPRCGLWLLMPGSLLASFALQYVQMRIMQWVGQETMYDLRKEIFEHLQRLPMSFFDRTPVGRLVTRSTTDVDALNDLFASGVARC